MLNLNKEGTPFARIIGGKYNNTLITMSDSKGFKELKIANDAKIQITPDPKTGGERHIVYNWTVWIWKIYFYESFFFYIFIDWIRRMIDVE